jgi:hypothetical protein
LNVLLSLSCGILLRTSALLRASILAVLLAIGLALALSRSGLWCPVWSILSVCQPLSCCEVANGMLTPYSSLQSEYSMTLSRHTSC